jgi:hypothetical protein
MLTQRLIVVSSDVHQLAALKAELGRGFDTAESLASAIELMNALNPALLVIDTTVPPAPDLLDLLPKMDTPEYFPVLLVGPHTTQAEPFVDALQSIDEALGSTRVASAVLATLHDAVTRDSRVGSPA